MLSVKFISSLDFRLYDVLMQGILDLGGGGGWGIKTKQKKPQPTNQKPKKNFSNVPLKVPSALADLFPKVPRSTLVHCSIGSSSDKLHPTDK